MTRRPFMDLSLGEAVVQAIGLSAGFVAGIFLYRLVNDLYTEKVAKKEWYPLGGNYQNPKKIGIKGPIIK